MGDYFYFLSIGYLIYINQDQNIKLNITNSVISQLGKGLEFDFNQTYIANQIGEAQYYQEKQLNDGYGTAIVLESSIKNLSGNSIVYSQGNLFEGCRYGYKGADVQVENIASFESGGFQYFSGNNFNSSNSFLRCRFKNIRSSINSIQNSLDYQPSLNKFYGGGVFLFSVKKLDLTINESFFENIEAQQLGGVLLLDCNHFSKFILQNNSFKNIQGKNQGAVIYSYAQNYQSAELFDNRIDCHPYAQILEDQNKFMMGEERMGNSQVGLHIFYFESKNQSTLQSKNNKVKNCINQYSEVTGNQQRYIVSEISIKDSNFSDNIPNMAGGFIYAEGSTLIPAQIYVDNCLIITDLKKQFAYQENMILVLKHQHFKQLSYKAFKLRIANSLEIKIIKNQDCLIQQKMVNFPNPMAH
ncbi:UNKNOWN [Stylonychia lemnae]|uniref:Uncharacterized protein n=1 Tax=Stylonychia lemnae TaxID=5949 RepID=A0A078AUU6_STYLE|nr:UNKNOWN [Stylonychia lemnae]|eukprot:CDW85974.1 UNKNOWN [Stylonychia lemnae]